MAIGATVTGGVTVTTVGESVTVDAFVGVSVNVADGIELWTIDERRTNNARLVGGDWIHRISEKENVD